MGYGASGGVATFIGLEDTPATYAGQGLKLAKVNVGETGLSLDLLLSFTDWYAGAAPASYPWILVGKMPFSLTNDNPTFSPILKNVKEEYYVYVGSLNDALLWKYNLTTGQWFELASPTEVISVSGYSLAMSPGGKKLAVSSGAARDKLQIYDIESNTWLTTAVAPNLDGVTPHVLSCVWADDDTVWTYARRTGPNNSKMYKYTVSTTTWDTYANSTGAVTCNGYRCAAIKSDGTIIYVGEVGAASTNYLKYTIATDNYNVAGSISSADYYMTADKNSNRLWYYMSPAATTFRYMDVDDESQHINIWENNPQRNRDTNINMGVFGELVCIAFHRTTEPMVWSYTGTGMWNLGQKVLTDYNLVVFRKPADGYAITAIDTINNFVIPIFLFNALCLPAGTWDFFYPKDGDYTQLKISGSMLK